MRMGGLNFPAGFIVVFIFWVSLLPVFQCVKNNTQIGLPPSELAALNSIYNNLNGRAWSFETDFNKFGRPWSFNGTSSNPCLDRWAGVECNCNLSSRAIVPNTTFEYFYDDVLLYTPNIVCSVSKLFLVRKNLRGRFPNFELSKFPNLLNLHLSINSLTGTLSSFVFGNLTKLQYVDLSTNSISGSIPTSIGYLSGIFSLSFRANALTGTVPESIYSLTTLRYLDLHLNHLHGSISSKIGRLGKLVGLGLYSNMFTQIVPQVLGNITSLLFVALFENAFSGPLPEFSGNYLYLFDCHNNLFSQSVPSSLARQQILNHLDLSYNLLTRSIPSSLGNLHSF